MENQFIEEQRYMDAKIEDVVRTIQQKAIMFYNEYKNMNDVIQDSGNALAEVEKLRSCSKKLVPIRDICTRELEAFASRKSEFAGGPAETVYNQVLTDLGNMIYDLDAYIKNLKEITGWITAGAINNSEGVKKGFDRLFGLLHERYEDFINSDNDVIEKLNIIKTIAAKNTP
jgi:hypothetical protein